jgi:single-stranded-DNA-specific exonuclease
MDPVPEERGAEPVVVRPWELRTLDEEVCARLARELGVLPATARCLVGRGLTGSAEAGAFLKPRLGQLRPPVGLAGFAEAVERLARAVVAGETVGLFGDYDVDGVTSSALLASFLGQVGARAVVKVAERAAGYGFGEAQAAWLAERGARVIVTVDCGTSDLPAIHACRARGVDVIVVDHHQVPEAGAHPALALLNPHRRDSAYPFRGLASVGLSFFVAAALRTALRERGWFRGRPEPDVRTLLDLVAVGTVADLAPLREENRVLVSAGLRELGLRRRPGLAALLSIAGVPADRALGETDIGWKLAPRLNAPGRLGDAEPALLTLLAADPAEALRHASACEEANQRRRELQDRMYAEAVADADAQAGAAAIVVARPGWHAGVAGIVAAKLVDRHAKPAVVIAVDASGEGRGSLRTPSGFDLYRALEACGEHLVRYGGHAQAAGLTVRVERIAALRAAFAAQAERRSAAAPPVAVDAVLPLGEVSAQLAAELAQLQPFGVGNEAPVLAAAGARVRASRRVGDDGSHLKLTLECERDAVAHSAIAFRMGDRDPGVGASVDVVFRPELSEWRGERRLELNVTDLKVVGPTRASAML